MILSLDKFNLQKYDKKSDDNISFGFYEGNLEELKEVVRQVIEYWAEMYNGTHRAYCGYVNGKVVSFYLVENKGIHNINRRQLKIGGPGCVGTLPEYRNRGVGLTMVRNVTQILKEEGYDYSYIHFTGVATWYEKLGYKSSIKWSRDGVI